MSTTVEAIYEAGILRLAHPIDLADGSRVDVMIIPRPPAVEPTHPDESEPYKTPAEIMAEIATLTPTFRGVTYEKIERLGSVQWPCNEGTAEGQGRADVSCARHGVILLGVFCSAPGCDRRCNQVVVRRGEKVHASVGSPSSRCWRRLDCRASKVHQKRRVAWAGVGAQ